MSFIRGFIFLLGLGMGFRSLHAVEVLFYELRGPNGRVVQLEEGGHYFHVALRYKGLYLHSDSWKGVVLEPEVPAYKYGNLVAVLSNPQLSLDDAKVRALLGKPYDRKYGWADEQIYCSELVAKLLDIEPVAMDFGGDYWKDKEGLPWGEPGVSPDYLYSVLSEREGWTSQNIKCESGLD